MAVTLDMLDAQVIKVPMANRAARARLRNPSIEWEPMLSALDKIGMVGAGDYVFDAGRAACPSDSPMAAARDWFAIR